MKLSRLAALLHLEHRGEDVELAIITPVEQSQGNSLTFASEARHLAGCKQAGAVVVTPQLAEKLDQPLLISPTPGLDIARAAPHFGLREMTVAGIHPSAVIDPTARLGHNVGVGARVVIGAEVEIGDDTVIHAGAVIHERCIIGRRCIIQSNAVIGSEGYAYEWDGQCHRRVAHFGIVRLGDEVEIGACTTIDRARFAETVIGDGSKIDNLVQIAHNCVIGRHCLIISQVGMAGSCHIGDGAILAGQAGLVPHVTVGAGARVAAASGVATDIPAGATWSGWWALPHRENLAGINAVRKLPEFMKKVTAFLKKHGEEIK